MQTRQLVWLTLCQAFFRDVTCSKGQRRCIKKCDNAVLHGGATEPAFRSSEFPENMLPERLKNTYLVWSCWLAETATVLTMVGRLVPPLDNLWLYAMWIRL
jgi:hypothetical protein